MNTLVEKNDLDSLIAGHLLQNLAYRFNRDEGPFVAYAPRFTNASLALPLNEDIKLVSAAVAGTIPRINRKGGIVMPDSQLHLGIRAIIRKLLEQGDTKEVITFEHDGLVTIWVILNSCSIEAEERLCGFFAEIMGLAEEPFDFRVINLDEFDPLMVPAGADRFQRKV